MFRFLVMLLLLAAGTARAEDNLLEEYAASGEEAARQMKEKFEKMDKPKYTQAYEKYLQDLEAISVLGKSVENFGLEEDLKVMNSDQPYLYSHQEGSIRLGL